MNLILSKHIDGDWYRDGVYSLNIVDRLAHRCFELGGGGKSTSYDNVKVEADENTDVVPKELFDMACKLGEIIYDPESKTFVKEPIVYTHEETHEDCVVQIWKDDDGHVSIGWYEMSCPPEEDI